MRKQNIFIVLLLLSNLLIFGQKSLADALYQTRQYRHLVKDGNIIKEEAEKLTKLSLWKMEIEDAKGIEMFKNVKDLNIGANLLVSLDLSQCTSLSKLNCSYNQLEELKIPNSLVRLIVNDNLIEQLDLTGLEQLNYLNCTNNNLKTLDLSDTKQLTQLYASTNKLTTIKGINNLQYLRRLYLEDNLLSSVNVPHGVELMKISNNINLTSLDLSKAKKMYYLMCKNTKLCTLDASFCNLVGVDFSSNTKLTTVNLLNQPLKGYGYEDFVGLKGVVFESCPQLECISINEEFIDRVQSMCTINGNNPNCTVGKLPCDTSLNTITGNISYATNSTQCSINNIGYNKLKLAISDIDNVEKTTIIIPSQSGHYRFMADSSTDYSLLPMLNNPQEMAITPAITNSTMIKPVEFDNMGQSINNFCVYPKTNFQDISVTMIPLNRTVDGFDTTYELICTNNGSVSEDGQVSLTFEGDKQIFVETSKNPFSQSANQIVWHFNDLDPMESEVINVTFNISNSSNTTNRLSYKVLIAGDGGLNNDIKPDNNTFNLSQEIVNFDNTTYETCLQGEELTTNNLGNYLHYLIKFENKSSEETTTVVVENIIDSSKLDIETLVPLSASHDYYTVIEGNKVKFIFENINLPSIASTNNGFISFKIKTISSLKDGEVIKNNPTIYFDLGQTIVVEPTQVVVKNIAEDKVDFSDYFRISPNPTSGKATLKITKEGITIEHIVVYDMGGNIVGFYPADIRDFDFSLYHSGTYAINIHTLEHGVLSTQLIKEDK